MSDARVLRRRAVAQIRSGRARARLAQRRRRGGARGRRRGAQRAAEDSDRRYRHRHHRAARRSDPPRQGRRHQERADRHRARHRDAGRRGPSVRSHDAARGHRDLRPQGQGRVRPRLGARRRAARLHHQRPVGRRRRRGARPCRRARRYRGAARALHRRSRPAHCRGLSAHPPLLPHPRRLWRRRAGSRRLSRLHRRRARALRACRPNACAWRC